MSKDRILVDMDGVLADFEEEFARRWKQRWPEDDFTKYQQRTEFTADKESVEIDNVRQKFHEIYTKPGLFSSFNPVAEGKGLEAVVSLLKLGYDVRIVTSAGSLAHAFSEKAHWIEDHLGKDWVRRLVITRDKHFVNGAVLIDDRPNAARGNNSAWQQIIYDQPYNQHVIDCPRLAWSDDDWLETIERTVAQAQAER